MKKYLYVFCIFILFSFFYYSRFDIRDIQYGLIYSVNVKVSGKSMEVIKINGKFIDRKIYLKNNENLKFGMYNLLYVWENEKKGHVLSSKPGYFNRYRQYIIGVIDKSYENYETKALSKAVIIGDKSELDKSLIKKFSYIGIMHLITISGLHIALIAGIIKDKYLSFIFITIYSFLIGFSASVRRVYLMKFLSFFGLNNSDVYIVSLLVLLLYNFSNIFDSGFVFTFTSVFVIIFIYPLIKASNHSSYFKYIYFNLCIQIALLPFNYYFSKNIPIFTFIANLVMIPVFTLMIEMFFINFILSLFGIYTFSFLVEKYYSLLIELVKYISSLKYISIEIKEVNVSIFIGLILISVYIFFGIWKEH